MWSILLKYRTGLWITGLETKMEAGIRRRGRMRRRYDYTQR